MRPRISSRVRTICLRTFRRPGLAESFTSAFSSIADLRANTPDQKGSTRAQLQQFGNNFLLTKDPLLLNWKKLGGKPVRGAPTGDSCIWKEGDTYFGLVGADCLVSSKNLLDWIVQRGFLEGNSFPLGDAGDNPALARRQGGRVGDPDGQTSMRAWLCACASSAAR